MVPFISQIMLEEALRSEMLYHCRALELLEPICVTMRKLEPDHAMEVGSYKDDRRCLLHVLYAGPGDKVVQPATHAAAEA
jgi:hypothetical protein